MITPQNKQQDLTAPKEKKSFIFQVIGKRDTKAAEKMAQTYDSLKMLRSKDDKVFTRALTDLTMCVNSKCDPSSEHLVVQQIVGAATAHGDEKRRIQAIAALRDIAMKRHESDVIPEMVANAFIRIFRKENETHEIKEEALYNFHEVVRHKFSVSMSKEMKHNIATLLSTIYSGNMTYRYLAVVSLRELGINRNAYVKAAVVSALNDEYRETDNGEVKKEIEGILNEIGTEPR